MSPLSSAGDCARDDLPGQKKRLLRELGLLVDALVHLHVAFVGLGKVLGGKLFP